MISKEHIHDIRHNNGNTGYSEHMLNTGHTYGTMENTMDIIETVGTGGIARLLMWISGHLLGIHGSE
jgi:hypothetical protein